MTPGTGGVPPRPKSAVSTTAPATTFSRSLVVCRERPGWNGHCQLIPVGGEVGEGVAAVGGRDLGGDDVVGAVAIGIDAQRDRDAGDAGLVGIEHAVSVGVVPYEIADRAAGGSRRWCEPEIRRVDRLAVVQWRLDGVRCRRGLPGRRRHVDPVGATGKRSNWYVPAPAVNLMPTVVSYEPLLSTSRRSVNATPPRPGSPASCTPLASVSTNTVSPMLFVPT